MGPRVVRFYCGVLLRQASTLGARYVIISAYTIECNYSSYTILKLVISDDIIFEYMWSKRGPWKETYNKILSIV